MEISAEEITRAEGDWLFWGTYGDAAATDQAAVVDGPLWSSVPAVANGGVVQQVSDEVWYLGLGVTGAKWPLDDVEVPFGSSLTISNEVRGRLVVALGAGRALLLAHPYPQPGH